MGSKQTFLDLAEWPAALCDFSHIFAVDGRWCGHRVRYDEWEAENQVRDWHVIYLIIDGERPTSIAGENIPTHPGTFFWSPAGVPISAHWPVHSIHAEFWFQLRMKGKQPATISEVPVLDGAERLLPFFQTLSDEVSRQGHRWQDACRFKLAQLLLEVERLRHHVNLGERQLSQVQCFQIYDYINEDPNDWPSAKDLARQLGLSHDYFSRLFRATFSMSPRIWLVRRRITLGARMLKETVLPVHAVAERLGYGSSEAFCRQFRDVIGRTPSQYRRA